MISRQTRQNTPCIMVTLQWKLHIKLIFVFIGPFVKQIVFKRNEALLCKGSLILLAVTSEIFSVELSNSRLASKWAVKFVPSRKTFLTAFLMALQVIGYCRLLLILHKLQLCSSTCNSKALHTWTVGPALNRQNQMQQLETAWSCTETNLCRDLDHCANAAYAKR